MLLGRLVNSLAGGAVTAATGGGGAAWREKVEKPFERPASAGVRDPAGEKGGDNAERPDPDNDSGSHPAGDASRGLPPETLLTRRSPCPPNRNTVARNERNQTAAFYGASCVANVTPGVPQATGRG